MEDGGGMFGDDCGGSALSLAVAGPVACGQFVRMAGTYGGAVAGNDGFRTWKYVDLSAFLRLLHVPGEVAFVLPVLGIVAAWAWLGRRFDWATAIAATLVLNLYVAVYDSVLIGAAFWAAADSIYARERNCPRGSRGWRRRCFWRLGFRRRWR